MIVEGEHELRISLPSGAGLKRIKQSDPDVIWDKSPTR